MDTPMESDDIPQRAEKSTIRSHADNSEHSDDEWIDIVTDYFRQVRSFAMR
jgi:hypothetical protein